MRTLKLVASAGISLSFLFSSLSFSHVDVKLMLDWFANPNQAAVIVAQKKGIFDKHHLNVEIIEPTDPNLPTRLVSSGKVDYALTYQPQLYKEIDAGFNIVKFATVIKSPLNGIMFLKKSGIKSISDLKGKKIGYSGSGFDDSYIRTLLEKEGISLKDVEIININFALNQSLMTGAVDAVISAYRNVEFIELEEGGYEPQMFNLEDYGVPSYEELIIVASNETVKDKKTKRLVESLQEATDFIKNNPEEAWKIFKSYKPEVLDTELNHKIWNATLPTLADNVSKLHILKYQTFADYLFKNKMISKKTSKKLSTYTIDLMAK